MINEYALDPSLLRAWAKDKRDYAEFMREYGFGTPRLISSFPKNKASKLRGYLLSEGPADRGSTEGRRYEEMVLRSVDALVHRKNINFESGIWKESVIL